MSLENATESATAQPNITEDVTAPPQPGRVWFYVIAIAVIASLALATWLWRLPELRPLIATAGAAIVTLAGPVLQFLPVGTLLKRITVGSIATLVTAGAWFATQDIQNNLASSRDEIRVLSVQRSELRGRLTDFTAEAGAFIRQRPPARRDEFLMAAGQYQRTLYRTRQYWPVLDFANLILQVDPENGHGLYYAAEAHRHFALSPGSTSNSTASEWFEMRDMLQKFLAAGEGNPDALTGVARDCYLRASGYCRERMAWVNHLMALDDLRVAGAVTGEQRVESLNSAVTHADVEMRLHSGGFGGEGAFPSTCQILRIAARDLRAMRISSHRANNLLASESICEP